MTTQITVDNFEFVNVGLGLYVIGLGAIVTAIGVLQSWAAVRRPQS